MLQSLAITPGTGKSHFCEPLGQLAIDTGRTAWFSIDELGALVRRHRADDSISKAIRRITRLDLIIVDDIGMLAVGEDAAEGFYRLVDAC
jgi:DNA replication protein DnaC